MSYENRFQQNKTDGNYANFLTTQLGTATFLYMLNDIFGYLVSIIYFKYFQIFPIYI